MYSSGGRNSRKTRSGASCTFGRPGTKPISSPPSTSTIGYGTLSRCATIASAATATRSPRTSSISRIAELVERPAVLAGQIGQDVARDAFDRSLTARAGTLTGWSQGEQVAAAVHPIAVSDDLSKLLQLV